MQPDRVEWTGANQRRSENLPPSARYSVAPDRPRQREEVCFSGCPQLLRPSQASPGHLAVGRPREGIADGETQNFLSAAWVSPNFLGLVPTKDRGGHVRNSILLECESGCSAHSPAVTSFLGLSFFLCRMGLGQDIREPLSVVRDPVMEGASAWP